MQKILVLLIISILTEIKLIFHLIKKIILLVYYLIMLILRIEILQKFIIIIILKVLFRIKSLYSILYNGILWQVFINYIEKTFVHIKNSVQDQRIQVGVIFVFFVQIILELINQVLKKMVFYLESLFKIKKQSEKIHSVFLFY